MLGRIRGLTGRRLIAAVLGGGLILAVIAFLVIYFVLFPTSSPKPFKLTVATNPASTAGTAPTAGNTAAGSLTGRWRIASGSLAGYRVREKLAFLPAQSDAVGRTSQITGSASFAQAGDQLTISAATFSVNVLSLQSDRSMRDEKIRQIGLESERYPTAVFALSSPLRLSRAAIEGKVAHVRATGTFEIHGVTKSETLPLELSLAGSTFEAAGSLTFPWGEFAMTAPSIGGFVNVTPAATLEFDLRLQQG